MTPSIDRTYPLDQAPDAMRHLDAGRGAASSPSPSDRTSCPVPSLGPGQQAGLDAGLDRLPVRAAFDLVRRDAWAVRDRLDELGAFVVQADTVIGRVRRGQRAVGDQPVQQRTALLLGVVVHAVAVGQQRSARW